MEWHDPSCRRLDLTSVGGLQSCLSCGSFEGPGHQDDASSATSQALDTSPNNAPDGVLNYAPIRQKTETRILILQPGEFEDPVRGDLVIVNLPSEEPYEALSYTWADEDGDSTLCKTMHLSGHPFLITANCEKALRRLRKTFSSRRVWVDAICIDQNNTSERGHQVRLMTKIYSEARSVLIYVGEAADDSDGLLSAVFSGGPLQNTLKRKRGPSKLESFFERRYFHRLWVLQEVALARKAELICGASVVSWDKFKSRVSYRDFQVPILQFDHRSYTNPQQLVRMMTLAARCQCHDPKDKVYGLLGLFPYTAGRAITPDYNLSVEEVYADMATYIASQFSWKLVFDLASTHGPNSPSDWPSWVPDWRSLAPTKWTAKPRTAPNLRRDLSLKLQVWKLRDIDAEIPVEERLKRGDIAGYYLPEKGIPTQSGKFLMFAENNYMFRFLPMDSEYFIEQSLSVAQLDIDELPGYKKYPQEPRGTTETQVFRINKRRKAMSYTRRFRCITIDGLLRYLRDHINMWDIFVYNMQDWVVHTPESLGSNWPKNTPIQELAIREMEAIAARFNPVDSEAEALWVVPDWSDLTQFKQRWISHNSWWPSVEAVDLKEFILVAAMLPPVDGDAGVVLPTPTDVEDLQSKSDEQSQAEDMEELLREAWKLETKRSLAWKILVRLFLPKVINAVVI
ncbi:TAP42-like family protein [Apiospora arundinis]